MRPLNSAASEISGCLPVCINESWLPGAGMARRARQPCVAEECVEQEHQPGHAQIRKALTAAITGSTCRCRLFQMRTGGVLSERTPARNSEMMSS